MDIAKNLFKKQHRSYTKTAKPYEETTNHLVIGGK